MTKVKIVAKDYTGNVKQMLITGNTVYFSEQDLPCEFVLNQQVSLPPSDIDNMLHITPVAKLTKQSGTHHITTSNGFTGTGTLDELVVALRDYLIDVNLDGQDMVFTNRNAQLVNISINAQGRSGKNYVAIEQENTSIQLDGKNVTFSLAQKAEVLDGFRFRLIAKNGFVLSQSPEAYTYSPDLAGTNGEKVLNLSNFIDDLTTDAQDKTTWSKAIEFSDVNHVMTNGGLTIVFQEQSYSRINIWIDMTDVENLEHFFDKVKADLGNHGLDSKIQIEYSHSAVNEPHIPAPDGSNGGFVFE